MHEFTYEEINFKNIDLEAYYKRGKISYKLNKFRYVFYIDDVLVGICGRKLERTPDIWVPFSFHCVNRNCKGDIRSVTRPSYDVKLIVNGTSVFNSGIANDAGELILPILDRTPFFHPAFDFFGAIGHTRDVLEKCLIGHVLPHYSSMECEPVSEMPDIF